VDDIKMNHQEIEWNGEDSLNPVQDRNRAMKFRVPSNASKFAGMTMFPGASQYL
jgi:hypothetical protein